MLLIKTSLNCFQLQIGGCYFSCVKLGSKRSPWLQTSNRVTSVLLYSVPDFYDSMRMRLLVLCNNNNNHDY